LTEKRPMIVMDMILC